MLINLQEAQKNRTFAIELRIHCVADSSAQFLLFMFFCGSSSVGRAWASQAQGRGFEPRLPLFFLFFNEEHTFSVPPKTARADCCKFGIAKASATNVLNDGT